MKLPSRSLSIHAQGEEVTCLQTELKVAGYSIDSQEIQAKRFGEDTERAVRDFQSKHSLQATGTVDDSTASLLSTAVAAASATEFIIEGRVTYEDGTPLGGVTVRAFTKLLRREELLGQQTTGPEGSYQIKYKIDAARGRESTDILIRAFSPDGEVLGQSGVLFNVGKQTNLDLTVPPPKPPRQPEEKKLSEYEKLLTDIEPILGGLPLTALKEADIEFLSKKTGHERQHLELVSRAAKLASGTDLPIGFYYALGRRGIPVELIAIFKRRPEELGDALAGSVRDEIVPGVFRDSTAAFLKRLQELKRVADVYSVRGRLFSAKTGEPLGGYTVRLFSIRAGVVSRTLGQDETSSGGFFGIAFPFLSGEDEPVQSIVLQTSEHGPAESSKSRMSEAAPARPTKPRNLFRRLLDCFRHSNLEREPIDPRRVSSSSGAETLKETAYGS